MYYDSIVWARETTLSPQYQSTITNSVQVISSKHNGLGNQETMQLSGSGVNRPCTKGITNTDRMHHERCPHLSPFTLCMHPAAGALWIMGLPTDSEGRRHANSVRPRLPRPQPAIARINLVGRRR
jgi:hypothetical protein